MVLYVIHFNIVNIISTEQSHNFTLFQKISTATFPAHHIHLDFVTLITEKAAAVMTHFMLP